MLCSCYFYRPKLDNLPRGGNLPQLGNVLFSRLERGGRRNPEEEGGDYSVGVIYPWGSFTPVRELFARLERGASGTRRAGIIP